MKDLSVCGQGRGGENVFYTGTQGNRRNGGESKWRSQGIDLEVAHFSRLYLANIYRALALRQALSTHSANKDSFQPQNKHVR